MMPKKPVILGHGSMEIDPNGPRRDYIEVAKVLESRFASAKSLVPTGLIGKLERLSRMNWQEAQAVYRQRDQHNLLLSLSEKAALPVAIIQQLTGLSLPHVVIGHKLTSGQKTLLFKYLQIQRRFTRLICLSRPQVHYAIQNLGMEPDWVRFVYDAVDDQYFTPQTRPEGDYLLAVGQEQRDYATLLHALAGTGLKLIVVASSPWSNTKIALDKLNLNIEVRRRIPYDELRNLYARARLIVLPLHEANYAAGANGLIEAMAMARPVVLSRTEGLQDYVIDQEHVALVPPTEPVLLREAIQNLWEDAPRRQRLGLKARQRVEDCMSLDHYVAHIVDICQEALSS
jgi:glycosyltransferase involved in cell wall biosynthesis